MRATFSCRGKDKDEMSSCMGVRFLWRSSLAVFPASSDGSPRHLFFCVQVGMRQAHGVVSCISSAATSPLQLAFSNVFFCFLQALIASAMHKLMSFQP